jgi:hypothetical protein
MGARHAKRGFLPAARGGGAASGAQRVSALVARARAACPRGRGSAHPMRARGALAFHKCHAARCGATGVRGGRGASGGAVRAKRKKSARVRTPAHSALPQAACQQSSARDLSCGGCAMCGGCGGGESGWRAAESRAENLARRALAERRRCRPPGQRIRARVRAAGAAARAFFLRAGAAVLFSSLPAAAAAAAASFLRLGAKAGPAMTSPSGKRTPASRPGSAAASKGACLLRACRRRRGHCRRTSLAPFSRWQGPATAVSIRNHPCICAAAVWSPPHPPHIAHPPQLRSRAELC